MPTRPPLCIPAHETILWHDNDCRIILVPDAHYGGFCRVIWQVHAKEMSELSAEQRERIGQDKGSPLLLPKINWPLLTKNVKKIYKINIKLPDGCSCDVF